MDDAAVFPPGSAALHDALAAHRQHRAAWYADLVGPLLIPASDVAAGELSGLVDPGEGLVVGVIGDTGIGNLPFALSFLAPDGVAARQVEVAVAKRGEDPLPGIAELLRLTDELPGVEAVYAELPLTFGLMGALDALVAARADGAPIAAKFRTGGLAAELFPTPTELAAVICACRDRGLPFKLTAGLHQAIRHLDPETGFTHHGYANVLAATLAAADGDGVRSVAELLTVVDPRPLVERTTARLDGPRPLWVGFGSCSILEPLTDLIRLGLVNGGYDA
ncbi:hypothetical protein GAR06_02767 [Micromonospora saelicesensis]|uniref:Uncharacterized protein n=1 Tax=Micromonospora saelicesensis TaxID=285676 RepID=A0ABX9CPY8_9ACTN|nr:hypothetical protein GAR05_01230 [Micromonospora saelicesensis]RAO07570.1 hypothetical protein LUPAC07_06144 [Micromonospora noduli]RAO46880.1 hypothetical protein GAR06_02767 [Micromonospora saelicesensis]RAO53973.1 hypothetical protein LUPAC06_04952 [Micromonospora saelicesensis]RAO61091.1 hypothetical protein PSN01_01847 [Micromonospora saelicesensis]